MRQEAVGIQDLPIADRLDQAAGLIARRDGPLPTGRVADADGGVTVVAENAVTGDKIQQKVDLAILATGMEPALKGQGAAFGLQMDASGFIIPDAANTMYAAGCAKKASDVVTSAQNSTAAALKAIQASRR